MKNNIIHKLSFKRVGVTVESVLQNQPFRFDTTEQKFDSVEFTFDEN